MEEKYERYKKSKIYKNYKRINIFLIILFLLIIGCVVKLYLMYKPTDEKIDENRVYTYELKDNTVYFSADDKLISSYECKNICKVYSKESYPEYFNLGKILLQDGVDIYLYDLLNNKKVSSNYMGIDYIFDGIGNDLANIKLFKVKDTFDKHGIMDLNGDILIPTTFNELGKTIDEKLINYSYDKNYITAKSGDKWGLIGMNNGKGLIDFQYDDIKLSTYNKLAVKEGVLWTLVDEFNKKIISKGYASIDIYQDNLVVSEDEKVFVLDTFGNVTSNKIDLYYELDPWATITIKGLSSEMIDGIIYLYVDVPLTKEAETYETITYYYDEENNELKIFDE
ncbi:MAG: hypothetical protein PHX04_03050 [Bacilli bacterium]|nr:hypothetical protein [Bacilli bacterium]